MVRKFQPMEAWSMSSCKYIHSSTKKSILLYFCQWVGIANKLKLSCKNPLCFCTSPLSMWIFSPVSWLISLKFCLINLLVMIYKHDSRLLAFRFDFSDCQNEMWSRFWFWSELQFSANFSCWSNLVTQPFHFYAERTNFFRKTAKLL